MRFMMMVLLGTDEYVTPDALPVDRFAEMMKFNEALQKAGVLLALDGLHPPSEGARAYFKDGEPTVLDGPFAEVKEVVGGYWIIDVRSREEAIEWAKRCPAGDDEIIEIRRVQEFADYSPAAQAVASGYPEMQGRQT